MARVNLWLRGARGKFAGSSLSKGANGETIAREVVTPTNPNTVKQRYQRAIMATVMRMYSAFSEILDHSFEGKAKGAECQQEFISTNATLLRQAIASDMEAFQESNDFNKLYNTVVLPKSEWPAPNSYLISKGSYNQYFFTLMLKPYSDAEDEEYGALAISIPAPLQGETIAQYAKRNQLIAGDIYTILALGVSDYTNKSSGIAVDGYSSRTGLYTKNYRYGVTPDGNSKPHPSYKTGAISVRLEPCWMRLQVKDLSAVTTPADSNLSTYFELTHLSDEKQVLAPFENMADGSFLSHFNGTSYYRKVICAGIIRSRLDADLRSTTRMTLANNLQLFNQDEDGNVCLTGITAPCIPSSWQNASDAIGSSDLILES